MRRMIAVLLVVALVSVVVTAVAVPAAHAGGSSTATNIALGLASFAVFNQLVAAFSGPPAYGYGYPGYPAYPAPAYYPAPTYYSTPVVYSTPAPAAVVQQPAPQYSRVVQYPHGRYELHGDGVYTAYQWVWIPNPPPPPPPPPAPPAR